MEHYLLRLSYSTVGWQDIVTKAPTFEDRMASVSALIARLGGSFASFHFYDTQPFQDEKKHHVVKHKFATFGGSDVMAVLAMPDKRAAQAFTIALSTQAGIKSIELVALVPFEDVIATSVPAAQQAISQSGYAGPGPK